MSKKSTGTGFMGQAAEVFLSAKNAPSCMGKAAVAFLSAQKTGGNPRKEGETERAMKNALLKGMGRAF